LVGGLLYLGLDALVGGFERLSVTEARECLTKSGSTSVTVTDRGVKATTRGRKWEGIVKSDFETSDYTLPVSVFVMEDDSLPVRRSGVDGFSQEEVANALVVYDKEGELPPSLLPCLRKAASTNP
jgi:hypothetical protein